MSNLLTPRRRVHALGGLAGLLAGTAAVAASEGTTALLEGVSSPILAVGNRAVDQAPRPLKEFAIETFGTADKPVLIGSVIGAVAVLAVVAGILGVRRPRLAAGIFLVLSTVAAAAALTDRAATAGPALRLVPVLVLVVVGLAALLLLLRLLGAPRHEVEDGADRPETRRFDRRTFVLAAAAVAGVAAVGGVVARTFGELAATASRLGVKLPTPADPSPPVPAGAALDVEGITPYVTPNKDFYRVDNALQVPDVPVEGWQLRIHGMVDRELTFSYQDLLDRALVERRITLTCVSNPVGGEYLGNAHWLGVPMHELLEEAGVQDGADAVRSRSADDFTAGTPLSVLQDKERGAMVAIGMNGEPLPLEHGFPARMVTPGLYGYVSATKWLVDLEVTRFADFKAYWTTRGYAAEAPIKTSSRIDVPRSFAKLDAGRTPVAGVAWSQTVGIEKVEVRVDRGDWQEATLAEVDNVNTWRQWVWEWESEPGNHTLEVRATDADGNTQTSRRAPIAPDGSTGWDSVNVVVA
jgi:DMSO/TMAO reductase YedYZ molybdopterin-dependent catalytic subunit